MGPKIKVTRRTQTFQDHLTSPDHDPTRTLQTAPDTNQDAKLPKRAITRRPWEVRAVEPIAVPDRTVAGSWAAAGSWLLGSQRHRAGKRFRSGAQRGPQPKRVHSPIIMLVAVNESHWHFIGVAFAELRIGVNVGGVVVDS